MTKNKYLPQFLHSKIQCLIFNQKAHATPDTFCVSKTHTNNSKYLLYVSCSRSCSKNLKILLHLTFRIPLSIISYYHLYFTDGKTETQKGEAGSHGNIVGKLQIWNSILGCLYQESMLFTAMHTAFHYLLSNENLKYLTFHHNTFTDMISCDITSHMMIM